MAVGTCWFEATEDNTLLECVKSVLDGRRSSRDERCGAKLPCAGQAILAHVPVEQEQGIYIASPLENRMTKRLSYLCRQPFECRNILDQIDVKVLFWFDTSVQVVPEGQDDSVLFHRSNVFGWLDLINRNNPPLPSVSCTGLRTCHFTRRLLTNYDDECETVPSAAEFEEDGCVQNMGHPTPLQSVRLWQYTRKSKAIPGSRYSLEGYQHILLQSCLKRSLVGRVIYWEEDRWNSKIRARFRNEEHWFTIESLTPRNNEGIKKGSGLFFIAPSTLITFSLPPKQEGNLFRSAIGNKTLETSIFDGETGAESRNPFLFSPVAESLKEILDLVLLRKQHTLKNSSGFQPPRTFLLTGPPGKFSFTKCCFRHRVYEWIV